MEDLMKNFEKEFEKLKKELKFKATLDELDEAFYLRDYISKEGYISSHPIKQISRRIIDFFGSWIQYLHGMLMANPSSLISMAEVQAFDEEDKAKANKLMDKMMIFSTRYNIFILNSDKKEAQLFIDESFAFWKKELSPALEDFMKKEKKLWQERLDSKPQKKDKNKDSLYG